MTLKFRNGSPPPPLFRPSKKSNFSSLVWFWSNLNWNIFICLPLINKITIWKERKGKFESDNVLDLVWNNHCDARSHTKIYSPWAKRFRGVIRPESSPRVFLFPKTLNLKKKSGGHLSVVAFGSERPLSENIYTFWNVFAATFNTAFKGFNFIKL